MFYLKRENSTVDILLDVLYFCWYNCCLSCSRVTRANWLLQLLKVSVRTTWWSQTS